MLERVLRYLRNWFVASVHTGEFTVENGSITLPFLLDGQYYRIVGSALNDGVHKYGDGNEMPNETFTGEIWVLAIPPALLELTGRIEEWEKKNGETGNSPYQSESFGGYSYSKSSESIGNGWQTAFRGELNVWRKI